MVKNLPANAGDASSIPGSGRSPGVRKWSKIPTPVFLPRKFHGLRSLMDYSPWGRKKTRLSTHTDKYLIIIFYPWNWITCQLYLNKKKWGVGDLIAGSYLQQNLHLEKTQGLHSLLPVWRELTLSDPLSIHDKKEPASSRVMKKKEAARRQVKTSKTSATGFGIWVSHFMPLGHIFPIKWGVSQEVIHTEFSPE